MEHVVPFDWARILWGIQPPMYFLEIVFRILAIYLFAVIVLRYMGKRGRQQLSSFEYVMIIALGSATGDSLFYPSVPILYAWLIIAIMVLLDRGLAAWQTRSTGMSTFLEGRPRLLVHNGQIDSRSLDKESMNRAELLALLREQRIADLDDVGDAFLETTGRLGVVKRGDYDGVEHTTYPENLAT
jgi:uncharacterized membrane protein YcaP (DUF421 family)